MGVAPFKAVGELVQDDLAGDARTCFQQPVDNGSRALRDRMGRGPIGITEPGRISGDIDQILDRKAQALERSFRCSGDLEPRTRQERAYMIRHGPKLWARLIRPMIECSQAMTSRAIG